MTAPNITSEVGQLREAVLHRPGLELRRLTPGNKDELLFDELLWVDRAGEEHDAFRALLVEEGVRVHLLADLLADVLTDAGVRGELIVRLATPETCGLELVDRVRGHLRELPVDALVSALLGGVTVAEVPGAGDGFVGGVLGPSAFLLPPLPNALFTRDPSAWIGGGVLLAVMSKPARQAEERLWALIYRHHPALAASDAPVWYGAPAVAGPDRDHFPATIEGGDVLVLSQRVVAVGISERSSPIAAENLAMRLFEADVVDWVLAIDLPRGRRTMHLDTVLTVVDTDAVVLWPGARPLLHAYRIEPPRHGGRLRVSAEPDLARALAAGMATDSLRVIDTGEDELLADREQWDDGNNTLALRPGVVVAYERNVDTNRRLRDAGIDVRTVGASELPRGRGGPRCMCCPLLRDPL